MYRFIDLEMSSMFDYVFKMYMKYVCYTHKDIKSASDIERANKIGICKHFPQYFECMNGQEPRDTASCLRKGFTRN